MNINKITNMNHLRGAKIDRVEIEPRKVSYHIGGHVYWSTFRFFREHLDEIIVRIS